MWVLIEELSSIFVIIFYALSDVKVSDHESLSWIVGGEREEQALNFQPVYEAHRRVVRTSFSMALTRERGELRKGFRTV